MFVNMFCTVTVYDKCYVQVTLSCVNYPVYLCDKWLLFRVWKPMSIVLLHFIVISIRLQKTLLCNDLGFLLNIMCCRLFSARSLVNLYSQLPNFYIFIDSGPRGHYFIYIVTCWNLVMHTCLLCHEVCLLWRSLTCKPMHHRNLCMQFFWYCACSKSIDSYLCMCIHMSIQ